MDVALATGGVLANTPTPAYAALIMMDALQCTVSPRSRRIPRASLTAGQGVVVLARLARATSPS